MRIGNFTSTGEGLSKSQIDLIMDSLKKEALEKSLKTIYEEADTIEKDGYVSDVEIAIWLKNNLKPEACPEFNNKNISELNDDQVSELVCILKKDDTNKQNVQNAGLKINEVNSAFSELKKTSFDCTLQTALQAASIFCNDN